MTFEQAHTTIKDLILNFQKNENHYLSPTYSEAEVRQEYIDPFFRALGWDVGNRLGSNPYEREVIIEKSQSQEDSLSKKRADYAFYISPNFKKEVFFVEAKKPVRTLRQNKEDYFQTAKYGYNGATGISLLTDFEEFVIIDCRFKPDKELILSYEIKYFKYTDFNDPEKFAEIYYLFSKEAVLNQSIKKYLEKLPIPKKLGKTYQLKFNFGSYITIDIDFLDFIENQRLKIAQSIYIEHPNLKDYELSEAVQKILDRLVFIRFLEDKSIENDSIIDEIFSSNCWSKFIIECKRLNNKYNSIVFKNAFFDDINFLNSENTIFNEVIYEFKPSESPYNFNYIPIEIIGNIYERFLGKTIEIKDNKVKIDLKPSVRKAGGVFYTPSYIVDYIVENTVGELIKDKNPKEISKMSFADISCGSGSFLIGIFDYLIKYHQLYYHKNNDEAIKDKCRFDENNQIWILSLEQKKQILLNNVYGVDIDHQATEVAQMSLLLKLLENENLFTTNSIQLEFNVSDKILPTLSNNIKSGNTLVGKDVVFQGKLHFNSYEEELKINPFDFEPAFPKVFKNGGFDAIVGNPPYVKEYTDREAFETVKIGKLKKYYQGKMDLWYFFACYGLDLLNSKGLLEYIAPNNWVSNAGASIMRNKVIQDSKIKELVDFGSFMVFKDASIQTMVMIFENNKKEDNYSFLYQNFNKNITETELQKELLNKKGQSSHILKPIISKSKFNNSFLKFGESNIEDLLTKIDSNRNFEIDSVNEITNGIHPHHGYVTKKMCELFPEKYKAGEGIFALKDSELSNLMLNTNEKKLIKPFYSDASHFSKYLLDTKNNEENIIYTDSSFKNISKIESYPNLKIHLDKFKNLITSDNKPYGLHRARKEYYFKGEKILSVRKCSEPTFAYTNVDSYMSAMYYIIKSERINLKYLTGILNSKLVKFWLFNRGKMQGNMFQIDKEPLLQIPIFKTENKEQEDKMISLVNQMLESKQREKEATSDREKEYLVDHIKSLDYQIDNLVYEMYGLSDEEIEVIKES